MKDQIRETVRSILAGYDVNMPENTAVQLRDLWLQFEPKSTAGVKEELREKHEHVGTPVEALKTIGKEIGKVARKRVPEFIPLARLLWDNYGREGRIVAVHVLGPMELVDPETLVPIIMDMCRTCVSWEDADQLAMNALEPIVRKNPDQWLDAMIPWLDDANLWVRRAGVTVVGRLAMQHAEYTARCVALSERLLLDDETDVKRAVSFALRLCARGDVLPVLDLLARHIPPQNPIATWVLCDIIRSMATKLLPEFASLLPRYEQWAADPALNSRDRRSIESAIKKLEKVNT